MSVIALPTRGQLPAPARGPVALPVTKTAQALYALGPQLRGLPVQARGDRLVIAWTHLDARCRLEVSAGDDEAVAALTLLRGNRTTPALLPAMLAAIREHAGEPGGWQLEHVARLLHGPRDRSAANRARELKPIRALLTLMLCGVWDVTVPVGDGAPASYGSKFRGPLVRLEPASARKTTLQSSPRLLEALSDPRPVRVPAVTLQLGALPGGQTNPEGHGPAAADYTMARVAAVCWARRTRTWTTRPDAMHAAPTRLDVLLARVGIDTDAVTRRRRWRPWAAALAADLAVAAQLGGVGLNTEPAGVGAALELVLCQPASYRPRRTRTRKSASSGKQRRRSA